METNTPLPPELEPRTGMSTSQAMEVGESGKLATPANAYSSCRCFGLSHNEARQMDDDLLAVIREHWRGACEQVELPQRLAESIWQRVVLSPAVFEE